MEYKEVIKKLLEIDLSTYPDQQILTLIKGFGKFGVIQMVLHPGKVILRARPMNSGDKFNTRAALSYKPAEYNNTYQRASTPKQTMFYGGVIPEGIAYGELDNARIIGALETSHLLRNPGHDGEQRVAFSKWQVTKDIPLIAICYHKDFVNNSTHTKELYEYYHRSIDGLDPELKQKSNDITEFLAQQFAKKPIEHDYEYMISAIFSEITVNRGMAGVYYPSIRADAKGYNVAISPRFTDECLRLVAAGECTIYKKGDHTIGDNDTISMINDDSKPFQFSPISPEYHMGHERVMEEFSRYRE
jgi:hypothetical protein